MGYLVKKRTPHFYYIFIVRVKMKTLRQISASSDVLWCKFFFRILKNIRQQQTNPVQSCVINNSFKHRQQHKGRIPTLFVVVLFGSKPYPLLLMSLYTLQMKGQWESNINVWFPFMYFQKWICYFQNRIIMFCIPVPTIIYLSDIYIFPGSVCLFCCREICGPILGIYIAYRRMNVEIGTEAAQFP